MAFQPVYYPYDYHSVYRPVVYRWTSTDYQPRNTFFAEGQVIEVRLPTTEEIDSFGISADSVILSHTPFATAPVNGELVQVWEVNFPTDVSGVNRYPDTYRIVRILSDSLMVISANYAGQTAAGGFVARIKGTYTVFATITGPNIPEPVTVALKPVYDPDTFGGAWIFDLDARDILARHFKDIKQAITPGMTQMVNAEGYLTMKYSVHVYAGYDVVDGTTGIATFTHFDGVDDPFAEVIDQVCVNAVQPYHHVERDGDVDVDWATSFDTAHRMSLLTGGTPATSRKFMTYMDRDLTTMRSGEDMFLAFMWFGAGARLKMRLRFGDIGGNILQTTDVGNATNATLGATSYIANVGTTAAEPPAGTTFYQAYLINALTGARLSEIFTFKVVPCKGINKRWYYLNKLGGVDAFTFSGEETRQMSVQRQVISKPNMRLPDLSVPSFTNDWQQRVWKTTPARKYTISSGYILPKELRTLAEEMFESPNIFTNVRESWWTNIIPITTDTAGDRDSGRAERFVIQYQLGVDNVTQRT
jgi:hypothetical protein